MKLYDVHESSPRPQPLLNENNIISHIFVYVYLTHWKLHITRICTTPQNATIHPIIHEQHIRFQLNASRSRVSAQTLIPEFSFSFLFYVVCCCFSTFQINIPLFYILQFIMSSLCRVMILFCCRQNIYILRACAESKRKCTFLYGNVHVECCASESSSSSSSGQPL